MGVRIGVDIQVGARRRNRKCPVAVKHVPHNHHPHFPPALLGINLLGGHRPTGDQHTRGHLTLTEHMSKSHLFMLNKIWGTNGGRRIHQYRAADWLRRRKAASPIKGYRLGRGGTVGGPRFYCGNSHRLRLLENRGGKK